MTFSRRLALAAAFGLAALTAGCGKIPEGGAAPAELQFSVLSAEDAQLAAMHWQPLVDDLQKQTGLKVKLYFSPNYSLLIQAMGANQVQLAWFSALPAVEAIERADAQVFARNIMEDGRGTYTSVILARKGSGLTIEKLMACDKTLDFGIGDAQSTSGTLAPMAFLFKPAGKTPQDCFKTVRSANHNANMLSVANGLVDAATNNSTGLAFYRTGTPEAQAAVSRTEVIWNSPDIPESAMLYRKDLDPAVQAKIKTFFLGYGKAAGAQGDHERQVMAGLKYARFEEADDSYLAPVVELRKVAAAPAASAAATAAKAP
jgi:phosphonate transport system substrate-binding protein